MCGPKFCSMEITQQVRDYAASKGLETRAAVEAGLAEKSLQFRQEREIYVPTPDAAVLQPATPDEARGR